MSVKKSKRKPVPSTENRESARRIRMLRIIVIVLSIILVLSMVLSLTAR